MPSHKKRNHSRNISRKKKGSKRSQKNVGKKKQFVSLSQFENILFGGGPTNVKKNRWKKIALILSVVKEFKNLKLPIKYIHPYTLTYKKRNDEYNFSMQNDIWSFGCTMIEMLQYGKLHFKTLKNKDILKLYQIIFKLTGEDIYQDKNIKLKKHLKVEKLVVELTKEIESLKTEIKELEEELTKDKELLKRKKEYSTIMELLNNNNNQELNSETPES